MKEKTLRYPGHVELMRVLKDTGFFSKDPLEVAGQTIRPLDATAALLFPRWTFEEGEADPTVMRVLVEGERDGRAVRYTWDLLDRFDHSTALRSRSRSAAFSAAIVARLLAAGRFLPPGVHAPETLGAQDGLLESVLGELRARGVRCQAKVEQSAPAPELVGRPA